MVSGVYSDEIVSIGTFENCDSQLIFLQYWELEFRNNLKFKSSDYDSGRLRDNKNSNETKIHEFSDDPQ